MRPKLNTIIKLKFNQRHLQLKGNYGVQYVMLIERKLKTVQFLVIIE